MKSANPKFYTNVLIAAALTCGVISSNLIHPSSADAQVFNQEQQEPNTFDMRFLDREGHKPSNPYTASGNDYHQHSYHRMLLNSPYAGSSIGLGVNASKQIFNKDAYDYMNPNSKKVNAPTLPPELDPYVQNAYAPKLNKHYYAGYDTNKQFNQTSPFAAQDSRFNASDSPFDGKTSAAPQQIPGSSSQFISPASGQSANSNQGSTSTQTRTIPSFLDPLQTKPATSPNFLFGNTSPAPSN